MNLIIENIEFKITKISQKNDEKWISYDIWIAHVKHMRITYLTYVEHVIFLLFIYEIKIENEQFIHFCFFFKLILF